MAVKPLSFAFLALASFWFGPDVSAVEPRTSQYILGLVGDSTVADRLPNNPIRGWGEFIGDGLGPKITVRNFAQGGASSGSFIESGQWENALNAPLDAVMIQFGHNDFFQDVPAAKFEDILRSYVRTARARKIFPILVTPVQRLKFKNGEHILSLTEYANATRHVARELAVPVVDLNLLSGELFARLGAERTAQLTSTPGEPNHFNALGATGLAQIVVRELRRIQSPVRELLPNVSTADKSRKR